MANILTDLAADIYVAADVVGREVTGFIPAATINANGSETAAVGQTVRSHQTRKATAVDITPSMTIPEGDDQTVDNLELTLTRQRGVQIPYTGEDTRFLDGGPGYQTVYGDQIAQAMRVIVNEVETDLAIEAYRNASRVVGTAGTTPFAANMNVIAEARQVLVDNGMPVSDGRVSMVMSTAAGTNLRNLTNLYKVNEAGSDQLLRQGVLQDLQGAMIRESAQVQLHTPGTANANYDVNNAGGYDVDATAIDVDTGSGTIVAGDVVTFGGDATNRYVVGTALTGGTITLNAPGLMAPIADGADLAIGGAYTANIMLHQAGLELAMRAPAKPVGGDAATEVMIVVDPRTGLAFEVAVYKGFNKAMIQVGAVWGYKAWNPDAIVGVMG